MSGPIELQVSGGVAGVDSAVVLELDGTATVTERGEDTYTCTVAPEILGLLKEEAQTVASVASGDDVEPKSDADEKGTLDPGDPIVPDAFNYDLSFDDVEYQISGGREIPEEIRPLLSGMVDIMRSAEAERDGENASDASASCSA